MRSLTAPRRQAGAGATDAARAWSEPRRRDPAPSRLAYRLERLWLTPGFRRFLRTGLPVLALVIAAGVYFGDAPRRAALIERYAVLKDRFENLPEFSVKVVAIDGATPAVAEAVRGLIPVGLPVSSFRLDLEAIRAAIGQIDAVEGAELFIRSGGVLQIQILERKPVVLWRTAGRIEMLDARGHRVATLLDRVARPDLPVIAGEGADARVPEALALLDTARPLMSRVRGLARVGDRRWDLVLDRDQRILLPEADPVQALERVIALDQSQDLLNRDIVAVDMRNADRPTLRLGADAMHALRPSDATATKVSAP
jgi:cell division protein FtsQ